MARLGSSGFVDDGSSNLTVDGKTVFAPNANSSGHSPYRTDGNTDSSSPSAGAFTITIPGFYWISGSTTTTGTIPAPDSHPGAHLTFAASSRTQTFASLLTGSARASGSEAVFARSSVGTGTAPGDSLTVAAGGSVVLHSDGRYWIPVAASGSLTIA